MAPRERVWNTATGRANFLICAGVEEDPEVRRPGGAAARDDPQSRPVQHDDLQPDDRYRGVFGGRMVVFMNKDDMAERGIAEALVEIESLTDGGDCAGPRAASRRGPTRFSAGRRRLLSRDQRLLPLTHHD